MTHIGGQWNTEKIKCVAPVNGGRKSKVRRFVCFLLLNCLIPQQGVTSILPVLREGVLTGNPDQKEEAAKALGLVIKLTSAEALKPSVVSITGPLIRILGDRFSWNVKVALLETLSLLLAKVRLKTTDRPWSS